MNCSVLLVESDRDQLESLTVTLMRLGFEVTAAYHPRLALNAATFKQFDLALVAENLPEVSGLELMQQLQHQQPNLHTILLCDRLKADFETEAKMHGAYACLVRPCEEWLLEETLELAHNNFAAADSTVPAQTINDDEPKSSGWEALGVLPLSWLANVRLN